MEAILLGVNKQDTASALSPSQSRRTDSLLDLHSDFELWV